MLDVLIVEDDHVLSALLGFVLTDAGFSVRQTGSAEEALREVSIKLPDLILLDVVLPAASGFILIEQVRKLGNQIPVLIHTSLDLSSSDLAKLTLGQTKYVKKTTMEIDQFPALVQMLSALPAID